MDIAKYREIYEAIMELAIDAESITEEDIAKCKWISLMLNTLTDVPARKAAEVALKTGVDLGDIEYMDVGFFDN